MKTIYILLFCLVPFANAFANQDQVRVEVKKQEKKDSIEKAVIHNQDEALKLSKQIDSLNQAGVKGKQVDDLVMKKNLLITQTKEMAKRIPSTESEEVQSNTLSIAMLIFGLLLILSVLIFKGKTADNDYLHTYKLIGIMFIGTISVFLIPAGFDNTQITPIVGLLGTLAGYLVGSSTQNNNTPKPGNVEPPK